MDPAGPLPDAVWVPNAKGLPAVYRGSPLDMVRAMSAEMHPNLEPRDAIQAILGGLARHRGVHIRLQPDADTNTLARLFLFALLDQRILRPIPTA